MLVKTILNLVEKYKFFVYKKVEFKVIDGCKALVATLTPRKRTKGFCSKCSKRGAIYDHQPTRLYKFVPLWNIPFYFQYTPRRITCPEHGVIIEAVPWCDGKEIVTKSYKNFLAGWAKKLCWLDVAKAFKTSWQTVYRAVESVVEQGLKNRDLGNVTQIGVDEIAVFKGHKYLTLVYQIDQGLKRLLWCGEGRSIKSLSDFFEMFGKENASKLKFVCSDLWKPYLKVVKQKAKNAVHILDRFHVIKQFNDVVDRVRRLESSQLSRWGKKNVLKDGRWLLLKKPENLSEKQTYRLSELLKINLMSIKAYLLKEDFQRFWQYDNAELAGKFLDDWVSRTLQTKMLHMKKLTKMLIKHKALILNWFKANKTLSSGVVEGLNNKAKVTMRKAYGFRSLKCLEVALYHNLGNLPEPKVAHRFW